MMSVPAELRAGLASWICLSRLHLSAIIFIRFLSLCHHPGYHQNKVDLPTPQTQAYPSKFWGWDKEYHAKWCPLKRGTVHKRPTRFPSEELVEGWGTGNTGCSQFLFFYLLIHFVQTLWTFGAFSSKYVKCSFREELQKPKNLLRSNSLRELKIALFYTNKPHTHTCVLCLHCRNCPGIALCCLWTPAKKPGFLILRESC